MGEVEEYILWGYVVGRQECGVAWARHWLRLGHMIPIGSPQCVCIGS